MANFIEVHATNGEPILINLDWVEEIRKNYDMSTIYFAFNLPNALSQDWMDVNESYEEIKSRLENDNG